MEGPNVRPDAGFAAELNPPLQPAAATPAAAASPVPEAISFRQLAALRQAALESERSAEPSAPASPDASSTPAAQPGRLAPGQPQSAGSELAELEQLLAAYEQVGQRLLQQLSRQGTALAQQRHPQQLMALGALGAHIRMGLQALAASRQ